jgi:hypothetical protein
MINVEEYATPQAMPCHNHGLFTEAEKELSAFLTAVTELRGQHCVTAAASHWMRALDEVCPFTFATRESFRKVSLAAAISLSHLPAQLEKSACN